MPAKQAEPEPAQKLKKAEPKQKPVEAEKQAEKPQLKATPKQEPKRTESPKPESVQLKAVKKEVCIENSLTYFL